MRILLSIAVSLIFILLKVTDADGDTIICKWADKNVETCGGICDGLPGAIINHVRLIYL